MSGSIRLARRAGTIIASRLTVTSPAATNTNVSGSDGFTPYTNDASSLPDTIAMPAHITMPGRINFIPCPTIMRNTWLVDARLHRHDLVGIGIRKRPQQDCVDHAEDGRVRSNAERQHDDGYDGKPRTLPQRAERDLQVHVSPQRGFDGNRRAM